MEISQNLELMNMKTKTEVELRFAKSSFNELANYIVKLENEIGAKNNRIKELIKENVELGMK